MGGGDNTFIVNLNGIVGEHFSTHFNGFIGCGGNTFWHIF